MWVVKQNLDKKGSGFQPGIEHNKESSIPSHLFASLALPMESR
jgi:hypothetical protein